MYGFVTPRLLTVSQYVLVVVALAAAALHAFPIAQNAFSEDFPVFDAVTMGWIGMAIIAVLLPQISEITLGQASLKLKEAKETVDEFESSLEDLTLLLENWSTMVPTYSDLFRRTSDEAGRRVLLNNYLRDRMEEARVYLGDDPQGNVRIALWLFNPQENRVEYSFSKDFRPTQEAYKLGEGVIGRAFLESKRFNFADIRSIPSYQNTRTGSPPYRAVLCEPVCFGSQTVGVLTVDKKTATPFTSVAVEVTKALAGQCAFITDLWENT
jgi:hypothetical protein